MRHTPLALEVTLSRLRLVWSVIQVGDETITCKVKAGAQPETPAGFGDVAHLAEADAERWAEAVTRYGLPDTPFRVVGGFEWKRFEWERPEDDSPTWPPQTTPDPRTPEALHVLTGWRRADPAQWASRRADWLEDAREVLISLDPPWGVDPISLRPVTVTLDWLRGYAQLASALDHVLQEEKKLFGRWAMQMGVPRSAAYALWGRRADLVATAVGDALATLAPVRGERQVRTGAQWTIAALGWWPLVVLGTCVKSARALQPRVCEAGNCSNPIPLNRGRGSRLVRYCSAKCYWREAKRRQRDIVRRIFDLHRDGRTARDIAEQLNAEDIPAVRRLWTHHQIRLVLKGRKVYAGAGAKGQVRARGRGLA